MARTRKDRRWYSISVETLRGWAIALTVLVAAMAALLAYHSWQDLQIQRQAAAAIAEVSGLLERFAGGKVPANYRAEVNTARESFEEARARYSRQEYRAALTSAHRARVVLQSILDAQSPHRSDGEGQFISAQGRVEYRRGESGPWEPARTRLTLRPGDYVRTSGDGSAEIIFGDGTLYTVRPNTQIVVSHARTSDGGSGEQSIAMEYGWVNLNTSDSASKVTTPEAEARVREESEAFVAYEKTTKTGRFGAYRGSLEVQVEGGPRREIGELQEVVASHAALSEPRPLPQAPELRQPAENMEIEGGSDRQMTLAWEPVAGSDHYALQVSRNALFVDNIIDVADRTKSRATLGIHGEGTFYWRVAALAGDGARGPWSAPRKFRIAAVVGRGSAEDRTPPELRIDEVSPYGNIFIVEGKTEPGTTVEINGEPVKVEADGSFTKTIQLTHEGWGSLEVRARDASGNESVVTKQVYVESS